MEDVFMCIGLRQDVGDFTNQTDWPDLNLNWLFGYCFYYFTAWLSRDIYMFCLLFTFSRVTISVVQKKKKMWPDSEI